MGVREALVGSSQIGVRIDVQYAEAREALRIRADCTIGRRVVAAHDACDTTLSEEALGLEIDHAVDLVGRAIHVLERLLELR